MIRKRDLNDKTRQEIKKTERIDEKLFNTIIWVCSFHEAKARKQSKTDSKKKKNEIEREREREKGEWKHRETLKNQQNFIFQWGTTGLKIFPETKNWKTKKKKQNKQNEWEGFWAKWGGPSGQLTWHPPKQRRETNKKTNKTKFRAKWGGPPYLTPKPSKTTETKNKKWQIPRKELFNYQSRCSVF